MKTLILVGIPGAGKSSILQEAMRQISSNLSFGFISSKSREISDEISHFSSKGIAKGAISERKNEKDCGKILDFERIEPKTQVSIHVINYGDQMLKEAASEGITRDMLRKLPIQDQQKIGARAARKMIQHQQKEIMIIDTHAFIRTSHGYCPGLPLEVLEILSPKACVLVECSPSIILTRRAQDHSRARDEETEEELSTHQELSRSFLTACSMFTGAILCCVPNHGPSISQNALPLVKLIQTLDLFRN
jgi:adenylate kinase